MTVEFIDHVLLVRMAATALIVIAVSWSVSAFGPRIGGALAGLPMVLGPGFFFLVQQSAADFVALSATYTLHTLSATQLFLLAYMFAARRRRPLLALGWAILAWLSAAILCKQLPPWPTLGAVCFLGVTWACLRSSSHLLEATPVPIGKPAWHFLLFRGVLAGTLVALVTSFSAWLGPASAGILLAYPIGYTVIATTVHEKLGKDSAIATLRSGLVGGTSLAAFSFAMAVLPGPVSSWSALIIATLSSIAVTVLVVNYSRSRRHAS